MPFRRMDSTNENSRKMWTGNKVEKLQILDQQQIRQIISPPLQNTFSSTTELPAPPRLDHNLKRLKSATGPSKARLLTRNIAMTNSVNYSSQNPNAEICSSNKKSVTNF